LATYVFFLPAHLAKAIEKEVINIEEKVQSILESKFQDWINAKVIVDSIMLEFVYDNDRKRRIKG
jgi:hypothetical protein